MAKTDGAARLAEGMLVALQAWPAADWPPTVSELARRVDPRVSSPTILSALRRKPLSAVALAVRAEADAPVALADDAARLAAAPATLEYILRFRRTKTIHLYTVAQLKEKITSRSRLRELFAAAVNEQIAAGRTPPGVGWIFDRKPKLFLLDDLHVGSAQTPASEPSADDAAALESPAPPQADFAARFDAAFGRLDRQAGGHNFVSLVALRRELAEFSREAFDRGLYELRRAGRFGLSAAESYAGISAEERESGIVEGGSLLLHISRKSP